MKVSALTLVHNRLALFRETLESVLNQSYPVHELIIIDDGSTEDVKSLISSFNEDRLKYFYVDRIGILSKLRNLAVSKAEGELLAFIDSDDLWHPDKIRLHVENMQATNSFISFSDCQFFNEKGMAGDPICNGMNKTNVNIFKELIERNQSLAFASCFAFRKPTETSPFDETLFAADLDFIVLASATQKATFIDRVLNYIRRHQQNMSGSNSALDITAPLEYNHTIGKLLRENLISKTTYRKIKAANYSKAGLACMEQSKFKKSIEYLSRAILLHPRFMYFKVLVKSGWFWVRSS